MSQTEAKFILSCTAFPITLTINDDFFKLKSRTNVRTYKEQQKKTLWTFSYRRSYTSQMCKSKINSSYKFLPEKQLIKRNKSQHVYNIQVNERKTKRKRKLQKTYTDLNNINAYSVLSEVQLI